MSLVLFGLGAVAGWTVAAVCIAIGLEDIPFYMALSWSVASLLVYGPIGFWNRRSWGIAALAALISGISIYFYTRWLEPFARQRDDGVVSFVLGFVAVLAVTGVPLVRFGRLHVLAYVLFVVSGVIPAWIAISIGRPDRISIPLLRTDFWVGEIYAIVLGSYYVMSMAFWGIPFWWPPGSESRPIDAR